MQLFEVYTQHDENIVKDMSNYGLYLIGGTAIDYWCRKFNIKPVRNRSNNDIDFYTPYSNKQLHKAMNMLDIKYGIEMNKSSFMSTGSNEDGSIEVDILIDREKQPDYCFSDKDIKVMTPLYLFTSKFQRYLNTNSVARKKIDEMDLIQLINIIVKRGTTDQFEQYLSKQNYGQKEEDLLNHLIDIANSQTT